MAGSESPIEAFHEYLQMSKAPSTVVKYTRWVRALESWSDRTGTKISSRKVLYGFAESLAKRGDLGPRTIRSAMAASRRYLNWLIAQGHGVADQIPPEIARVPNEVLFTPTEVDVAEFLSRVDMDAPEPHATVLHILAGTGMRVSEACGILDADGRIGRSGATKGWIVFTLRKTKNHRQREVPLLPEQTARVVDYLTRIRKEVPGSDATTYLFPGKRPGESVTRQAIEWHSQLVGKNMGAAITPHSLRRFYVTRMTRLGVDRATVMKIVGHTNAAMFDRYYSPTVEDLVGKIVAAQAAEKDQEDTNGLDR